MTEQYKNNIDLSSGYCAKYMKYTDLLYHLEALHVYTACPHTKQFIPKLYNETSYKES